MIDNEEKCAPHGWNWSFGGHFEKWLYLAYATSCRKKHQVDYLPQGCTKLNSTINFSRPQKVYGIIRQGRSICFVNINTLRQYTYCRAVEKEIHSNNFDLNPNVGMHNSLNGEYTHWRIILLKRVKHDFKYPALKAVFHYSFNVKMHWRYNERYFIGYKCLIIKS